MTDVSTRALFALLILLVSLPLARAQDSLSPDEEAPPVIPVYEIELIVFEYVGGVRGSREDWSYVDTGREAAQLAQQAMLEEREAQRVADTFSDQLTVDGAAPIDPDGTAQEAGAELTPETIEQQRYPLEYMPVDRADYRLSEQTSKMRASRDYRPLLHVAWKQPVYDPLHETTLALDRLVDLPPTLAAEASLYVNRFLHLTLDLKLAETGTINDGTTALDTLVFQLKERRKMRSAELHFFDHPRFGALALISRTEETRPAPEAVE